MKQSNNELLKDLSLLGEATNYPQDPDEAKLEAIPNQWQEHDYLVELDCPEFTCVCPKTSQPDFAKIYISYIPAEKLIESKALKLYLGAYRNYGIFHEYVVNKIARDLQTVLQAKYLRVFGDFSARGGISIKPSVELGDRDLGFSLLRLRAKGVL